MTRFKETDFIFMNNVYVGFIWQSFVTNGALIRAQLTN